MKRSRLASSHVLRIYVHRVNKPLHTGDIPITTGLKKLPEGAADAAASVYGTGCSRARTGDAVTAAAATARRCGAEACTVSQWRGGWVRGGQIRLDPYATLPLILQSRG